MNRNMNLAARILGTYAVIYVAYLYLPVMFLPLFSFNDSIYISFPLRGWTLQWYQTMFANEALHRALMNSLKVGITTALISTVLGILGARAVTQYRLPGQKQVVGVIMLPLVVPEIILAMALLIIILQTVGSRALGLVSITAGHILLCVPFAMVVLMSRFEGFDRFLEEASHDLGENAWWTFWRVTFPNVLPGIVASLLLTFTISFDEFIMAFFLGSTDPTLPVFMWNQLRFPKLLPGVLALGACILIASVFIVLLAEWFRRRNTFDAQTGDMIIG
jgi:spermidine/putrescine transport system permease protein